MNFSENSARITQEIAEVLSRVDGRQVEALVQSIIASRRLFLEGRGRSGLMMRAFAIRLTHLNIPCHVVGESTTPALRHGDLLLVGSGSGETLTMLQTTQNARAGGGTVAALTARGNSTLAVMADLIVVIPAPVRESHEEGAVDTIQPMASLFEQSLLLLLETIVLILKERLQRDERTMMARHSNLE